MKKVLLLLFSFLTVSLGLNAQNLQNAIQQFRNGYALLAQSDESTLPDTLIARSENVIRLYNKILQQDSTVAEPYLLFLPYRVMGAGYDEKKQYNISAHYYELSAALAINYAEKLGQLGLNKDGYISLFASLQDVYTECKKYDEALSLSKEMVQLCKQQMPQMTAYQIMRKADIERQMGKSEAFVSDVQQSIEAFKLYGNSQEGFCITTPILSALSNFISSNDYQKAVQFMDKNRETFNSLLVITDTLEISQLQTINQCMYRCYMELKMPDRAVNVALIIANNERHDQGDTSTQYAIWLDNAASAYLLAYNIDKDGRNLSIADTLLTKTENIWSNYPHKENDEDYATFLGKRGVYYSLIGNQDKAEQCYIKSLALHQKQRVGISTIMLDLTRLAEYYSESGQVDKAVDLYLSMLGKAKQDNDSTVMANICQYLSMLYLNRKGDAPQAEKYAIQALDILKAYKPESIDYAIAENNLSGIYSHIGLWEKAVALKTSSIWLKQKLGYTVPYNELLDMYLSFVDAYSSVIKYYPDTVRLFTNMALSFTDSLIKKNDANVDAKIKALKLSGTIYMFLSNYAKAEKALSECLALETRKYGEKDEKSITTMNNLAYCYLLDGNYSKSKEIAEYAIKLDKSETAYQNQDILASIGILTNDSVLTEKALQKMYNGSLDYLTSRFLFLSSEQREEFINGDNIGISNISLAALFFPNDKICAGLSYNSALVSKGLLLNTTRDIETISANSNDKHIIGLYADLQKTKRDVNNATDSIILSRLQLKQKSIEKELMQTISSFKDFTSSIRTDWKDVQKHLGDNDVSIEFLIADKTIINVDSDEYYCAALLRKGWKVPKFVVLSKKSDADNLVDRIVSSFNNGSGLRGAQWKYISGQLYKKIWKPIESFMSAGDTVYFSPVGMLSLAPLESLPAQGDEALGELYNMRRLTTTKELCNNNNFDEARKNNEAVLFGGLTYERADDLTAIRQSGKERQGWQELPATATEIENISMVLNEKGIKTVVYEKDKGTESAFKSLSGRHLSALHIATHGFYFNDRESNTLQFLRSIDITPNSQEQVSTLKRTGIMLSGGQAAWLGLSKNKKNDNDGILLSSEISALDFHNVNLVVLSACQTGLGDISDDGVVGLQRAFKMAGAKTLVMTLWKVDDNATAVMMNNFYKLLMDGLPKQEAFKKAKQMVKKEFKDPFYWAPFIMLD